MSTDPESDDFRASYAADLAERARNELEKARDLVDRFTTLVANKGSRLSADSFNYIQNIGIVAAAPGLAKALIGSTHTDRDGLYSYADLAEKLPPSQFQAGYFVGHDYMLMAHPYFRRQMHSNANWAPRFIDVFSRLEISGVKKFLAIDENRVRINVDDTFYFEADTWYGAPFNDDVRLIKPGIVKLCPPPDIEPHHVDFLFAKVHCLDIKWSETDRIKTFQALELKTKDVHFEIEGETYFPARYLHAEFDVTANCFRHFDGAIQLFSEDEYFQRRDDDFNMTMKNPVHIKARSKKLFKLNGSLGTDAWADLCCQFYTSNPLTFGYFTGAYPEHITDILVKLKARNT
jgi:hypothetical protein